MEENTKKILDYKNNYGNDNIYHKEIVKKKLIANEQILKAINNSDLDIESPDDYLGVNIYPYYLLPQTQTNAQNYICFETSFNEITKSNRIMKQGQLIFYILCNNKTIFDNETGIARHDLLSALITDEFNWCTDFGNQFRLISDKPYAVDNNYIMRTLVFEQITLNSIVEAQTKTIINNNR